MIKKSSCFALSCEHVFCLGEASEWNCLDTKDLLVDCKVHILVSCYFSIK